jgi:hypothetical protein
MAWLLGIGLGMTIIGGIAAVIVVVRLPKDYFTSTPRKTGWHGHLGKKLGKIAKNLAGVALIVGGIVLSLPGIPGPGIVILLLGLAITDIPGKHKMIVWIAKKPAVMKSMNRVRRKFHRQNLVAP